MTQPKALEGAMLTAHAAAAPRAFRPMPKTDFGAAFAHAERTVREPAAREPARKPDAAERVNARDDEPKPPAAEDDQASRPDASDAATQAPKPEASPSEPTTAADDAAADRQTADAQAEAAAEEQALTADQALALMIATGVPAGPTAAAAPGTDAGAIQALGLDAGAAPNPAELAAQLAAQAPTAEVAATQAAPTQGQAGSAPATAAQPGGLTALGAALNVTGLEVQTAAAPAGEPANMLLALAEADADQPAPAAGSITLAPASDAVEDGETLAPAVLDLDDDAADGLAAPAPKDAGPTPSPTLNAERPVEAGKAEAARGEQGPPSPDEVLPQLLKHAEAMKAQQQNAIKLQLYPEHLGKMEIKVQSHQGVLSAQLTADSQHVKAMLEGQVAQLQRSLQELGLKVDKVEVTLSSANLGGFDMSGQAFADQRGQGFGQAPAHAPRWGADAGYGTWLGDEPAIATTGADAPAEATTAINYVA